MKLNHEVGFPVAWTDLLKGRWNNEYDKLVIVSNSVRISQRHEHVT